MALKYKRILLKISGEALGGEKGTGFDEPTMDAICGGVKKAHELGVQIGIVVGGGAGVAVDGGKGHHDLLRLLGAVAGPGIVVVQVGGQIAGEDGAVERAMGIEPTSSAWKADILADVRCPHRLTARDSIP